MAPCWLGILTAQRLASNPERPAATAGSPITRLQSCMGPSGMWFFHTEYVWSYCQPMEKKSARKKGSEVIIAHPSSRAESPFPGEAPSFHVRVCWSRLAMEQEQREEAFAAAMLHGPHPEPAPPADWPCARESSHALPGSLRPSLPSQSSPVFLALLVCCTACCAAFCVPSAVRRLLFISLPPLRPFSFSILSCSPATNRRARRHPSTSVCLFAGTQSTRFSWRRLID